MFPFFLEIEIKLMDMYCLAILSAPSLNIFASLLFFSSLPFLRAVCLKDTQAGDTRFQGFKESTLSLQAHDRALSFAVPWVTENSSQGRGRRCGHRLSVRHEGRTKP